MSSTGSSRRLLLCETCRTRLCRSRADYWERLFFAMTAGPDPYVECAEYEPVYFHGIEGVMA